MLWLSLGGLILIESFVWFYDLSVCLSVSLPDSLYVCILVRLSIFLSYCLSSCLSDNLQDRCQTDTVPFCMNCLLVQFAISLSAFRSTTSAAYTASFDLSDLASFMSHFPNQSRLFCCTDFIWWFHSFQLFRRLYWVQQERLICLFYPGLTQRLPSFGSTSPATGRPIFLFMAQQVNGTGIWIGKGRLDIWNIDICTTTRHYR